MSGTVATYQGFPCRAVRFRRTRGWRADTSSVLLFAADFPHGFEFVVPDPGGFSRLCLRTQAKPDLSAIQGGAAGRPRPLPQQRRLNFAGDLVMAEVDRGGREYVVVVDPLLCVSLETVKRNADGSVAIVRARLVDARYFYAHGFLRRWSFNRTDADANYSLDSVKEGGEPYKLGEVAKEAAANLFLTPTLAAYPSAWDEKTPEVEFPRFSSATAAMVRLSQEHGTDELCLNLDGSVALWEPGDGKVGYAPEGKGAGNPQAFPQGLQVYLQGTGQSRGVEATYPPDYVVIVGGLRVATVRMDELDPVLVIDNEPVPLTEETVRKLTKGKYGLDWLEKFVLAPQAYQNDVAVDPRVVALLREQAYRLWRIPDVEREVQPKGERPARGQSKQGPIKVKGPNAHLLPLRARAETAAGKRLPVRIDSFRFTSVHRAMAPSRELQKITTIQKQLRDLKRQIQSQARQAAKPDPWNTMEGFFLFQDKYVSPLLYGITGAKAHGVSYEQFQGMVSRARLLDRIGEVSPGLASQYEAQLSELFGIEQELGGVSKSLFELAKEAVACVSCQALRPQFMSEDPLGAFRLLRPSRRGSEPRAAGAAAFGRGTVIAERYQIVGFLGQGGTADVYLAADYGLERHVALKVLREPTPQRRQRFEREAQIAASIKHPNVISVFGTGVHAGHAYVVYELIEGAQPLDQAAQGLDLDARLTLFEQLLAGVAAAHALGVTHRDLKPDNVLVQAPGRLFVADFGLAHVPESSLTATGQFMGTPSYMAPEQVVGADTSPATDVWALGLLLYELVYQRSWYEPGTPLQTLLAQIVQGQLDRPPGAPPELERLIFKEVLLKEPSARFPDADAFLQRLGSLRRPGTQKAPARLDGGRAAALLLVGALLGAGSVALATADRGPPGASGSPSSAPSAPETPGPHYSASPAPSPSAAARLSPPSSPAAGEPKAEPYGTQAYFARRRELLELDTPRVLAAAERGDLAALRLGGVRLAFGWRTEPDFERGVKLLKRAAERGCPDSPGDLAKIFSRQAPERSKRWRKLAAERGSPWSHLVRAHEDLSSPPPVKELRPAVEAGDDEAARYLALYFALSGRAEEAENWTSVAISLGSVSARGLRGMLKLQSRPKSFGGAVADLQAAAEVGDTIAIFELTRCCLTGRGVPKDLAKARQLFRDYGRAGGPDSSRALLSIYLGFSEAGASDLHFRLKTSPLKLIKAEANQYVRGEAALFLLDLSNAMGPADRERVLREAEELFRSSHRSVNPQVHIRYGLSLTRKVFRSLRAKEEAFAAYERAHLLGSLAGTSNMGACLLNGRGVERDTQRALALLERAAQGDFPRAWLNLGHAYSKPSLLPELLSYPKALAAFARAGELGLSKAYYARGKLLATKGLEIYDPDLAKRDFIRAAVEGKRTHYYAEAAYALEKNGAPAQARELYELSLRAGDTRGVIDLARHLLEGLGGKAEPERAVRLLLETEPSKESCSLLADCYARGRGVEKDPARAEEWRQRASRLDK